MSEISKLQTVLYEADQILQRALLITGDAPFFMHCSEEEYARLIIDGDTANLAWPEYTSDYYGGGCLERQNVDFPSQLLLMSVEEITAWKTAERKKHDAAQKIAAAEDARRRAVNQTAVELQTLSALLNKYGKPSI